MTETMPKRNDTVPLLFSVIVTACICAYFSFQTRDYTLDDALIYHRYIQNCLDGNGLVYNLGEKFNGLTSPLYTYISLAAAFIFKGNIQYSQSVLCGLFLFLTCVMLIPLFRNAMPDKILVLFPPLLAGSAYFYKTFGLETILFQFLILAAIVLFSRARYFSLAIVCALLLLTRGESLFLVLVLLFFHFRFKRPFPSFRIFLIPFIIFTTHFSFMYFYYGALLPNTLSAKIMQGYSGLWGRFAFMHHIPEFYAAFFDSNALLVAVLAALSLLGVFTARRNTIVRIMLVYLILYCSFYIVFNIPDYFWYYGYAFLALYVFAFWGIEGFRRLLCNSQSYWIRKYHYPAVVAFALLFFVLQTAVSQRLLNGLQGQVHYKTIGHWIQENTEPEAKIACIEIGHIGWYSKRYIIDMLGLVSPHNADIIGKRDFDGWLDYYTPDYIVTWVPLRPHEVSVAVASVRRPVSSI